MTVNISDRHVTRACFVSDVVAAIRKSRIAPHRLVLEVTESILLESPRGTAHLAALRQLGVGVSLDRFGSRYNTLARLRDLPVDTIKVDRQFLQPGDVLPEIMQLIVTAAHTLGLNVVAEGVENADQLELARQLGCESAQGFLLGRPSAQASRDASPRNLTAV